MGDMRKQFCICGWNRIIVETEYRPFDKRIGGKDIHICGECVAAREAGSPKFQEDYAMATSGTHASVTDTKVVKARKVPKDQTAADRASMGLIQKIMERGLARRRVFSADPVYTTRDLRRWFRIGLLAGAFWCALIAMALVSLGVLHW